MEVSSKKSKVMKKSSNTTTQIFMNGQKLEEVRTFKYLGATMTKISKSTKDIKSRIAVATYIVAKLDKIWKSKEINFATRIKWQFFK